MTLGAALISVGMLAVGVAAVLEIDLRILRLIAGATQPRLSS